MISPSWSDCASRHLIFLALTTFETTFPQRQDIIEKFRFDAGRSPANIVTNGPFLLSSWKHEDADRTASQPELFSRQAAHGKSDDVHGARRKPPPSPCTSKDSLDFIDDQSIPALEKNRLSKQRGFKSVPQLRGEYYGFAD